MWVYEGANCRWAKVRKHLESFSSEELKGRVEYRMMLWQKESDGAIVRYA